MCLADHLCCHAEKVIRPTLAVFSLGAEPDDQGEQEGALETVGSPES